MERLEFRRSRIKTTGIALGGVALVVASVFMARTGEDQFLRGIGWFGAVFFSLGTAAAVRQLFSSGPVYVFDEQGIHDIGSGIGLIPWVAIESVDFFSISQTPFMSMSLDRPDVYLGRLSGIKGRIARMTRGRMGLGDWALAFVGISPGIDEAEKFIQQALAPHLSAASSSHGGAAPSHRR